MIKLISLKKLIVGLGIVSLAVVGGFGCKDKGGADQKTESSGADKSSADDDKKTESAKDEDKDESAKVGPKGPSSIDHAGITEVPTDSDLVEKGKTLFKKKGCKSCHAIDNKVVGPPLGGVTERREPEWLARMLLSPDAMLEKDPTAKKLLQKHMTPMPDQGLEPEEAKALIAYFGSTTSE